MAVSPSQFPFFPTHAPTQIHGYYEPAPAPDFLPAPAYDAPPAYPCAATYTYPPPATAYTAATGFLPAPAFHFAATYAYPPDLCSSPSTPSPESTAPPAFPYAAAYPYPLGASAYAPVPDFPYPLALAPLPASTAPPATLHTTPGHPIHSIHHHHFPPTSVLPDHDASSSFGDHATDAFQRHAAAAATSSSLPPPSSGTPSPATSYPGYAAPGTPATTPPSSTHPGTPSSGGPATPSSPAHCDANLSLQSSLCGLPKLQQHKEGSSGGDLTKGISAGGAPISDERLVGKHMGSVSHSISNAGTDHGFVRLQATDTLTGSAVFGSTAPTPVFSTATIWPSVPTATTTAPLLGGTQTLNNPSSVLSSAPSTLPNTATTYDTHKVFGEMPAQNSWHGTHGTTPNYSPGHEKPIQNSCVQSVSTSSGCHNLDGMPQTYGFHNLHRQSVFLADGTEHNYFTLPADYPSEHAPQPMSPLVVEHVGVTARLSAPCLAPANCSKANNTAGYDSLPVHGVQLPIVLQDAPNVFTEMPIYDDSHGQSNAFVVVLASLHDQQTYEEQQEPEHPIKCFSRAPEIEQTSAHVSYYAIEQNGETASVNVPQLRAPRLNLLEIDEMRKEWHTESSSLKYMLQSVSHPPILSYSFLLRYYSVKGNSWLNTVRQSMRDHVEGLKPLSLSTPWDPGDARLHVLFTTASNSSLIAEVNTPRSGSIVMAAIAVYEVDTEEVEVKVDSGKPIISPERPTDGIFSFTVEKKSENELLAVCFNNTSDNAFVDTDFPLPHGPVTHASRSIDLTKENSTQVASVLFVQGATVHFTDETSTGHTLTWNPWPVTFYLCQSLWKFSKEQATQMPWDPGEATIAMACEQATTCWRLVCIEEDQKETEQFAKFLHMVSENAFIEQSTALRHPTDPELHIDWVPRITIGNHIKELSVGDPSLAIQQARLHQIHTQQCHMLLITEDCFAGQEIMAKTCNKMTALTWDNSVTGTPLTLLSSTNCYVWDPGIEFLFVHQQNINENVKTKCLPLSSKEYLWISEMGTFFTTFLPP